MFYRDLKVGDIWRYPRGKTEHVVLSDRRSRVLDSVQVLYVVPSRQEVILVGSFPGYAHHNED